MEDLSLVVVLAVTLLCQTLPVDCSQVRVAVCNNKTVLFGCSTIAPAFKDQVMTFSSLSLYLSNDSHALSQAGVNCNVVQSQCTLLNVKGNNLTAYHSSILAVKDLIVSTCDGKLECTLAAPAWNAVNGSTSGCPDKSANFYLRSMLIVFDCNFPTPQTTEEVSTEQLQTSTEQALITVAQNTQKPTNAAHASEPEITDPTVTELTSPDALTTKLVQTEQPTADWSATETMATQVMTDGITAQQTLFPLASTPLKKPDVNAAIHITTVTKRNSSPTSTKEPETSTASKNVDKVMLVETTTPSTLLSNKTSLAAASATASASRLHCITRWLLFAAVAAVLTSNLR